MTREEQLSDWHRWIGPGDPERAPIDLVRPFNCDQMKAWRLGLGVIHPLTSRARVPHPERVPGPPASSVFARWGGEAKGGMQ